FGDGDLDSNNIVSHTYQSYGTFVPILLLSDTTCTYALPPYDTITILAPPIAAFSVTGQCDGDSTTFLPVDQPNAGKIISYNWNFGDGKSSSDSSPVHKYAKLGKYNVTLTMVNELGCTDKRTQKVTIGKIDADFDATNHVACFGTPINFKASSIADTTVVKWFWDFGDGATDTVKNPSHFYTKKGYFDVKMTEWTATDCMDSL